MYKIKHVFILNDEYMTNITAQYYNDVFMNVQMTLLAVF